MSSFGTIVALLHHGSHNGVIFLCYVSLGVSHVCLLFQKVETHILLAVVKLETTDLTHFVDNGSVKVPSNSWLFIIVLSTGGDADHSSPFLSFSHHSICCTHLSSGLILCTCLPSPQDSGTFCCIHFNLLPTHTCSPLWHSWHSLRLIAYILSLSILYVWGGFRMIQEY